MVGALGLPGNSSASLNACQARIDAHTLNLQVNHVVADLEFFNRIGRIAPLGTWACALTAEFDRSDVLVGEASESVLIAVESCLAAVPQGKSIRLPDAVGLLQGPGK